MELHDVVIIGGGPAGLSAAVLLGRARRTVVVVDSGEGRNRRARRVNGYLGLPEVSPAVLRSTGQLQARRYGVEFINGLVVHASSHAAQNPEEQSTAFEVRLADGRVLRSRKLLFTTGIRDRLPQIPGFAKCYGITIHHCPYCDGWEHRDSRLVAFGESPESVVSLAETLLRWSDRVAVVTSGRSAGASEQRQLRELGVAYHEATVAMLEHDAGTLRGLRFSSGEYLAADALFFSAQSDPCCHLPVQLGCRPKEKGRIETTDRQGTGVPGVFLAGDADGEVQFAIVAASEGAIAGMAVNKELQQEDLAEQRLNLSRRR